MNLDQIIFLSTFIGLSFIILFSPELIKVMRK